MNANDFILNNIYKNLENSERSDFVSLLWEYSSSISFNSYYYYLLKFFTKNNLDSDIKKIKIYIKKHYN